jgi:hypothetical protein
MSDKIYKIKHEAAVTPLDAIVKWSKRMVGVHARLPVNLSDKPSRRRQDDKHAPSLTLRSRLLHFRSAPKSWVNWTAGADQP